MASVPGQRGCLLGGVVGDHVTTCLPFYRQPTCPVFFPTFHSTHHHTTRNTITVLFCLPVYHYTQGSALYSFSL